MKYKNELDDFVRRKLQERQPDFSPQAWQEVQQMLEAAERKPNRPILWGWWMVVAAAFLLSAYVFLPGATHPVQPTSSVQTLVSAKTVSKGEIALPQLQLSSRAMGQKPPVAATLSDTKYDARVITSARSNTPKSHAGPPSTTSPTAKALASSNTPQTLANENAPLEEKQETTRIANFLEKMRQDEGPVAAREYLSNRSLASLSAAPANKLPKQADLTESSKLPKPNLFDFSLIGGWSVGQMNNPNGLQRNVISPLLGLQLDYTLWRKRGLRLGIGLAAMIQSYQNMQHQSLIKRSLHYDFGYSKTTQWIDLQHLSILSTPLLIHFQMGAHRISAGPNVLWRLSYAQSIHERKETNFGLVSSSTAIMDQNLEQAGLLSSRSINEQTLESYAPKLHHLAWHLCYELQFARRWSIGAASTLGATDWVENNRGHDFWMSGQGFLKFHF